MGILASFGLPAFVLEAAKVVTQKQVRRAFALLACFLPAGDLTTGRMVADGGQPARVVHGSPAIHYQ
ncbi:hypothetical protein DDK22_34830 [Cupriavidus necator]|uniref:Uncharacterized protein n=1 Tax=Cupriavidus necator TaxID=106590 RepID=A0A367P7R8_CUPNE|nr:hypothetical protein DDK22_34830 [Cupriavidus necator]